MSHDKDSGELSIEWNIDLVESMQEVDHYIIRINNEPPILVKNRSAVLIVQQQDYNISVTAVDMCESTGEAGVLPSTIAPRPDTTASLKVKSSSIDTDVTDLSSASNCKGWSCGSIPVIIAVSIIFYRCVRRAYQATVTCFNSTSTGIKGTFLLAQDQVMTT